VLGTQQQQQQHYQEAVTVITATGMVATRSCCYCHCRWQPLPLATRCPCSTFSQGPLSRCAVFHCTNMGSEQHWHSCHLCSWLQVRPATVAATVAAAAAAALMCPHLSSQSQSLISTRMPGRLQGQGHSSIHETSMQMLCCTAFRKCKA
jgi:hypothetical protein